jgi:Mn2+/Fe2+ NRAMP family transporter
MIFSYPLMCVIQEISARIGRTTGRGIAGNICKWYPNWLLLSIVSLLLVANTINIGADLGAMGNAVGLLIGGHGLLYVALFGILCATLQIFMQYQRYVSVLKWLTLALFAYFGTAMVVKVPWGEVAWGLFVPLALGAAARLHPRLIIFCFLSGGVLFGMIGVILAVPVALITKTTLAILYDESG